MSYSDAYDFWYKACIVENDTIKDIINSLIRNHKTGRGIPVLINRNPTINYSSILQMFCTKMTSGYTMGIPLQILKGLGADKRHVIRHICQSPTYWQQSAKNLFNCWKAIRASRATT